MKLKLKILFFAAIAFYTRSSCYAQSGTTNEIIKSELFSKVSSQFSFYDIIDTITIADTVYNYFYNMYLVDSSYSASNNEATLKIFYCGKRVNDKLEIGQSYIVKSRKTNPLVFTKTSKNDTIVFISDDLKHFKRDCMQRVSKRKLRRDPVCIPVAIEYYRIEKLKVLPKLDKP
jgi:hypothetical protein